MTSYVLGRGAGEVSERPCPRQHGAAAVAAQSPRGGGELGAGGAAVQSDRRLSGMGRRGTGHGSDVVDQRAIRVMADRGDDGYSQQRHRSAETLVAECI